MRWNLPDASDPLPVEPQHALVQTRGVEGPNEIRLKLPREKLELLKVPRQRHGLLALFPCHKGKFSREEVSQPQFLADQAGVMPPPLQLLPVERNNVPNPLALVLHRQRQLPVALDESQRAGKNLDPVVPAIQRNRKGVLVPVFPAFQGAFFEGLAGMMVTSPGGRVGPRTS